MLDMTRIEIPRSIMCLFDSTLQLISLVLLLVHILFCLHGRIWNRVMLFYDGIIRMILLRGGSLFFIEAIYPHGKIMSTKGSMWWEVDVIMVMRNLVSLFLVSNYISICLLGSKVREEGEIHFWMPVLLTFDSCCSFLIWRSEFTSWIQLIYHKVFRVLKV